MKKILVSFLVFTTIIIGFSHPVLAETKNDVTLNSLAKTSITEISDSEFKEIETSVNEMSDKEFDDFITKYVKEEDNQNKAKEKLSK